MKYDSGVVKGGGDLGQRQINQDWTYLVFGRNKKEFAASKSVGGEERNAPK